MGPAPLLADILFTELNESKGPDQSVEPRKNYKINYSTNNLVHKKICKVDSILVFVIIIFW